VIDAAERADEAEDGRGRRLALALGGGAFLCLAGAGLLLWSRQGSAVFADVVLAAVAWCF
jgi:glucose dehydrogenase